MGKASRRKRERREFVQLAHAPYKIPADIFFGARVSWFMEDSEVGRWRLRQFEVTEEEYGRKALEAHYTAKRPDWEKSRLVPPGEYVSLQRRMTEYERAETIREKLGRNLPREVEDKFLPPESQWVPVMSDTPAEIVEHGPPLLGASGRVLITGLGLGMLPHALLNLDTLDEGRVVTGIDIIEIDPDVVALTGHYLADPRVRIWRGSADDITVIPKAIRDEGWDYAWHDIWSQVAGRNLHDDEAEHGISYGKLFDLWGPHIYREQWAWAYDQAVEMERIHREEVAGEREFRRRLHSLPLDEAVRLMMAHIVLDRFQFNENTQPWATEDDVPDEAIRMIDPKGEIAAHTRVKFADPAFWDELPDADEPEPLGRPNEEA